ncbi:MAG: hypothetical protein K8W52_36405 [Deltaproteobacteria bacterium]|nr:hypothetical protein [Deltaproteobacteria bacterium]
MRRPRSPLVAIIAGRRDTRDELLSYLDGAGLPALGTDDLGGKLAAAVTEIVLFPDDFPVAEIAAAVPRLRRAPRLLVLVTSEPQRHAELVAPLEGTRTPLVMAKPAFGWMLVDAIRAHREAP